MIQFTPSDSVLLHGEVFSEKIDRKKRFSDSYFLLGLLCLIIGVAIIVWEVVVLIWPGSYFGNYFEVTDFNEFFIWMLFLQLGIMFLYAGFKLCTDKNYSWSSEYYLLPDEKNLVNLNTLAITILEAAIIANIDKGFVTAEILDDGEVLITPTQLKAEWPADSIEDRLNFTIPDTLRNITKQYIGAESNLPAKRIIDKARIGMIVRGILPKNIKSVIGDLRQQSFDMQQRTKEMLNRVSDEEPELEYAIYNSLQNAANDLLHVRRGLHDNFRENNAWEAETSLNRYHYEFLNAQKMSVLMAINLFFVLSCCMIFVFLNLPQYRYIVLFSILVGVAGQLNHFLQNLSNPKSQRRKAKYLESFIDPVARARVEESFVDAKRNPVRYYLPAILLSGIVVSLPFFIYPLDKFWGVISGVVFYGLITGKYLSDRSKRKKAKNQQLMRDIFIELDQSSNNVNSKVRSTVSITSKEERGIKSTPFIIKKYNAMDLEIDADLFKRAFNNRKQIIQEKKSSPYHMLTLRVFNSKHMDNFLVLIKSWRYLGSIMRLNGPDTVDDKSYTKEDLLLQMIKDNGELHKALAELDLSPNWKGKYAINGMQCTNATWKDAIHALIEKAFIIVIDLSAVSEKNKGLTYELNKIVNEIPLQKVVMLMDHTTDEAVLYGMFKEICDNIKEGSPNLNADGIVFQLLNTGGAEERKNDESEYAWRKRTAIRVNEMQLMNYLFSITNRL